MALKSTIFKATLNVADLDRNHYHEYALTVARHPSETDERMMMRLLGFVLFADPRLEFGKGLSTTDEPALWLKDYSDAVQLWIEVGLPDERTLKRALSRAGQVVVIAYGGRAVDVWWQREGTAISRLDRVQVLNVPVEVSIALASRAERNMTAQCTIQEGHILWNDDSGTLSIEPQALQD